VKIFDIFKQLEEKFFGGMLALENYHKKQMFR